MMQSNFPDIDLIDTLDDFDENVNSFALIDINYNIKFKFGVTSKQMLKDRCKSASKKWETINLESVDHLKKLLGQGYTVRPAIKSGKADDSIISSDWLFLDFDEASVTDTLEKPLSDDAAFYYHSPSYVKGENEKHRLVFKLSRTCNPEEYEKLYTAIRVFYPESDHVSRGSIFFGAVNKEEIHDIGNGQGILDVEPFLGSDINFSSEPKLKPGVIDEYKDGLRTRILTWVNNEIWNGVCGNDIDKLYCLHKHRFQDMPKGTNLAKWGGHRPEDISKKTGTGFFVYWDAPDFPPRFDNQGAADINGTFLEYWHHYSKELFNKDFGDIHWEAENSTESLQKLCENIAEKFEIEPLDLRKVKREVEKIKKEKLEEKKEISTSILKDVVSKYVFEDRTGTEPLFIYYDLTSKLWRVRKDIYSVYRHCIKPALIEAGLPVEDAENLKFIGYINQAMLKGGVDINPLTKLEFDELKDFSKLPLSDGDFDIYTKEFTPGYKSEIFNQRRYNYTFQTEPGERSEADLKRFFEWLEWTYKDSETRQMILDWLALNIMGVAYETELMVCLWGTPGTGKSIILNLINWMMGDNVAVVDSPKLCRESNFMYQNFDGAMSLTIDEFKINQSGWDGIKKFTGSANSVISIEKKGLPAFNSKVRLGITTASQDKFILPNSDDGGIRRRIIPIHHSDSLKNDSWSSVAGFLSDKEVYQQIFFWLLENIDPREAIERVKNYAKSEKVKMNLLNQMVEQDDVLGFMKDCLEFTDNPSDDVSSYELQIAFKMYLEGERLQHLTDREQAKINMVTKYIREKAKIQDNKIEWKLCPDVGQEIKVNRNGKRLKGLRGIKIKADFFDNDLPI